MQHSSTSPNTVATTTFAFSSACFFFYAPEVGWSDSCGPKNRLKKVIKRTKKNVENRTKRDGVTRFSNPLKIPYEQTIKASLNFSILRRHWLEMDTVVITHKWPRWSVLGKKGRISWYTVSLMSANKQSRVGNSLMGFSSKSLVFWANLTFALLIWATWANHSGRLFVKSDGSESLNSLFKKKSDGSEWLNSLIKKERKSDVSDSLLSIKNCQNIWKIQIFRAKRLLLREIRLNHERFTHIALF